MYSEAILALRGTSDTGEVAARYPAKFGTFSLPYKSSSGVPRRSHQFTVGCCFK